MQPERTKKYPDRIFGYQLQPHERLQTAIDRVSGIRHQHQSRVVILDGHKFLSITVQTGTDLPCEQVTCWYRFDDQQTLLSLELVPQYVQWSPAAWQYYRTWTGRIALSESSQMIRYWLGGRHAGGDTQVFADDQTDKMTEQNMFCRLIDPPKVPDWSRKAVIYQVFLDRYSPGRQSDWLQTTDIFGLMGGNLQGVSDHLDEIQSLGCNTLWLSPVFTAPSHHGYNSTDLFQIEPRFGTMADFQNLIQAAHERGMYVLLDFVANHWSDQHPTFQEARQNPESPYIDWYTWQTWPETYACYFGVKDLPQLNLRHPATRRHVLDAARYWLEQGVDGYRLDHAAGPPRDFWAEFTLACQEVNPQCWLFGELPEAAGQQQVINQVLHPALDFQMNRALRETFALQSWPLAQFAGFLDQHLAYLGPHNQGPVFLDNHDMNRFLFAAGNRVAALKQAALMAFTLPGPPVLYYGTEVGLRQERPVHASPQDFGTFEEARLPMWWDDRCDKSLMLYFTRLFDLRKRFFARWSQPRHLVLLNEDAGVLVQQIGEPAECIWLAVNRSNKSYDLILDVAQPMIHEHLSTTELETVSGRITWKLPAGGVAFFA